jgi:undecaprenyl-diphosphatase
MTKNLDQKDPTINRKTDGLRITDILIRHKVFFVTLILLNCLIFGLLAFLVNQQGALVRWDVAIVNNMHVTALASPAWVKSIMVLGDYIGTYVYFVISLLLVIYFAIKKHWKEFSMVLITCIGQSILFLGLTNIFVRPRPVFSENIGNVVKYFSFPSGHMVSTVILFGFLAYFFVPKISSRFWKTVVILLAVLLIAFVGLSRFFMGAHYLTDIVAGTSIGIIWLSIVIMSFESISRKGDEKHVK